VTRIGITLPSFRDTVEPAVAVARAGEAADLDGVFAYDHLFRRARDGTRRPAIEMFAMLGAIAAETSRIGMGSLVARATLRPPATLAHGFDTVARLAGGGRLLVTVGAGDAQSSEENESFGLPVETMADRLDALRAALVATRDRGYPVWVGGRAHAVRDAAARLADGWNWWGAGVEGFRRRAAELRATAVRAPFVVSWGGLVVLARNDDAAEDKARRLHAGPDVIVGGPHRVAAGLRAYADAGADWLMVGPIDSSDPENATILGESVVPLLRAG
jgi:alkanesulfonate monooxygenase SsuD/methylene tetrahydromethanopterin reductase-like flavin-dependent oxidoreductase (luciferase family)